MIPACAKSTIVLQSEKRTVVSANIPIEAAGYESVLTWATAGGEKIASAGDIDAEPGVRV